MTSQLEIYIPNELLGEGRSGKSGGHLHDLCAVPFSLQL